VSNHAINGYSAKSFILNGKWQPVFDSLKEGDYVFIEFGHNDEKLDKPEGSTLKAFHDYLVRYVNETRAKKAIPVLLTPIMRRVFSGDTIVDTHGGYPNVTRTVAREYNVILIDMHSMSKTMLNSLGDDDSRKLFNWIDSGVNANYPKGLKDNTHLNPYGAHKIAELAIKGVKDNIPGLGKYLK
jgi:lysophospholipase L1-like esterase